MIDPKIIHTLVQMPKPLQTEVGHYAQYLLEKYLKSKSDLEYLEAEDEDMTADRIRDKLEAMGITDEDVTNAIAWSRKDL
ncbi:DUF2281 domain-containing protein [Roseofilum reptotaenium CS-1145]|uniref:Uncharacterized protein n=1 Tax=Roseofilum reptotaenium AO1-A TaxID=1925591 RepID=A0A1L9QN51_9CYAN|nr:DUF2281 domain-containing protein [Roseofilum reptotaenium]MDB9519718.1 DUF2281 domain-containing protein [Roseofilum reptotaenium CS-1145]OJJ24101.1 hypothetical protein BI308_18160 [Roseofilum reptotaenium AO1-A]